VVCNTSGIGCLRKIFVSDWEKIGEGWREGTSGGLLLTR